MWCSTTCTATVSPGITPLGVSRVQATGSDVGRQTANVRTSQRHSDDWDGVVCGSSTSGGAGGVTGGWNGVGNWPDRRGPSAPVAGAAGGRLTPDRMRLGRGTGVIGGGDDLLDGGGGMRVCTADNRLGPGRSGGVVGLRGGRNGAGPSSGGR